MEWKLLEVQGKLHECFVSRQAEPQHRLRKPKEQIDDGFISPYRFWPFGLEEDMGNEPNICQQAASCPDCYGRPRRVNSCFGTTTVLADDRLGGRLGLGSGLGVGGGLGLGRARRRIARRRLGL